MDDEQDLHTPVTEEDKKHALHVASREPLDLKFRVIELHPRGLTHPNWIRGIWVTRGETYDHEVPTVEDDIHAISWSSCSDGQNGYEYRDGSQPIHENRSGGVMVKAFVDSLREQPRRTYGDLLVCLGQRLRTTCEKINKSRGSDESKWIMQEPQLGSHKKPNLEDYFEP